MNIAYQKRDKYLPLENMLRVIKKEIELHSMSTLSLNRQYSGKLAEVCKELFNINASFTIEDNTYLFNTEFPSLPGVEDLTANMNELLDDKKREAYLNKNTERLAVFKDLTGRVNNKEAKMEGDYADFSFRFSIDIVRLMTRYSHTPTEVTSLILNEIGKVFAYVDFLDGMKGDIKANELKLDKDLTFKGMLDVLKRIHVDSSIRVTELRRLMDSYDDLSSEFVSRLGWGRELALTSVALKSTYKSVNRRRWIRLLPGVLKAALNIVILSWLSFIAVVSYVFGRIGSRSITLLILSTLVLVVVLAVTMFLTILNIIYGVTVIALSSSDTINFNSGRYKVIRKTMIKQIKHYKGVVPSKDLQQIKSNLRTLEMLETLIPRNDSFFKKLFSNISSDAMLSELQNNELYVRHFELSAMAK